MYREYAPAAAPPTFKIPQGNNGTPNQKTTNQRILRFLLVKVSGNARRSQARAPRGISTTQQKPEPHYFLRRFYKQSTYGRGKVKPTPSEDSRQQFDNGNTALKNPRNAPARPPSSVAIPSKTRMAGTLAAPSFTHQRYAILHFRHAHRHT